MNEEAIRFGEDARLCAIAGRPNRGNSNPAIVFISAGLLPKSGPFRMYTEIARHLTRRGFATFRVDLSGNGDSKGALTAANAEQVTVADTRAAIDAALRYFQCDRVVLFGLCSGAEAAHRTALVDERVTGVIALDGFISRNFLYYLCRYLPRMTQAAKWRHWLRKKLRVVLTGFGRSSTQADAETIEFWDDSYPDRKQLEKEYGVLCRRSVRQLLVFSSGSVNCSYQKQFHHVFKKVPGIEHAEVRYFSRADHTYILASDRDALQATVSEWLCRHFGAAVSTSESARPRAAARGVATDRAVGAATYYRTNDSEQRSSEGI